MGAPAGDGRHWNRDCKGKKMMREPEFEMLLRVPPELAEVHDALELWAAWSWGGRHQGRCASIEGRYNDGDAPSVSDGVRARTAARVHSTVCQLPVAARWMLHLWYVHRKPPGFICRRLGVHRSALVAEINKSRRMLANRLKMGVAFASTTRPPSIDV